MKKVELTKILFKHMSKSMVYACINGNRRPLYNKMLELSKEGIPLSAWADIKSFITDNDTKSKKCAQELPPVTGCDDGNSGVQSGESVDVDSHNDGGDGNE
jgi:hypothetical protein